MFVNDSVDIVLRLRVELLQSMHDRQGYIDPKICRGRVSGEVDLTCMDIVRLIDGSDCRTVESGLLALPHTDEAGVEGRGSWRNGGVGGRTKLRTRTEDS